MECKIESTPFLPHLKVVGLLELKDEIIFAGACHV
jgi:hypothetical protein